MKLMRRIGLVLAVVLIFFGLWRITSNQSIEDSTPSSEPSFSFSAVGDFDSTTATSQVLSAIKQADTDFTLALGDLSYGRLAPEVKWCDYVKKHLGTGHPFQLVPGSHEDDGDKDHINRFAKCLPNRLPDLKGDYPAQYYFDNASLARFIVISPGTTIGGHEFDYVKDDQDYQWLKTTLDSADEQKIKWVVVSMHKNCLSSATKLCEISPDIFNLMVEQKVDLILQGHDHIYQRSKPLVLNADCPGFKPDKFNPACVGQASGSRLLIIGTGGRHQLDPYNLADPEAGYFTAHFSKFGFGRFEVSANSLKGQFLSGGQVLDEFTIEP